MTDKEIRNGFWYWDRENNWPPESITLFEDFNNQTKLNLNITQINVSATEQKRIFKKWSAEFPNLKGVKYLWFCSKVNQQMFDSVCEVENLEGLYIKWSGIKNIEKIVKLKNLKHLHIGSSSQLESIEILSQMKNLISLNLEQLNKISDFSPLSTLTNLQGLGIDGNMWATQKLDNIKPLSLLTSLKYLTLTNTSMTDKSFDPLLSLFNLERFNSSWNYSEIEFAKLKKLPNLKFGNVETSWKEIKSKLK